HVWKSLTLRLQSPTRQCPSVARRPQSETRQCPPGKRHPWPPKYPFPPPPARPARQQQPGGVTSARLRHALPGRAGRRSYRFSSLVLFLPARAAAKADAAQLAALVLQSAGATADLQQRIALQRGRHHIRAQGKQGVLAAGGQQL